MTDSKIRYIIYKVTNFPEKSVKNHSHAKFRQSILLKAIYKILIINSKHILKR